MNILFQNIYISYEGKSILEDISGKIDSGDKIGLVGINGIGKTTLLKLLTVTEEKDSGIIKYSPQNIKIQFMNQYLSYNSDNSVFDEVLSTSNLSKESRNSLEPKIKSALSKAGLSEELWNKNINKLSGGEKTKVMLSKLVFMVDDCDILVLDEPTNHLDMESSIWLENFLSKTNKTMLIVSHDRYFLDKVVSKMWELSPSGLKSYEGNYSNFRYQREIEIRNTLREYNKQEREIHHLKEVIDERKNWFQAAHKAAGQNDFYRSKSKKHASIMRAKEKQLKILEDNKIQKPKKEPTPCFDIINKNIISNKLPRYLIQAKNINKSFGQRTIFSDTSFSILRDEKVALLGKNGTGKSTLLKMINGIDTNYKGTLSINPSVKIGYFAQELENLRLQDNIIDNVLREGISIKDARLLLSCLLFKEDDVFKKVENLSMGERSRVAFAKLMLKEVNLLILDEPTNYMDIASKEKIEDVLEDYKGSILFVSHDRYLIERLASKILEIDNQTIKCYIGDYKNYLDKKKNETIYKDAYGYRDLCDTISKLECELAFLSGKLSETLTEEEQNLYNVKFLETAKELNILKEKLKH